MIENYTVDPETYEVTGTFEGQVFTVAPKLVDNVLVAVDEVECAEILEYRKQAEVRINEEYYKVARIDEYPSIGDQLDALWKGGEAAAEMLAKVQAVKAKYPKPTE